MKTKKKDIQKKWTILEIIQWATAYLDERKIENPRLNAEVLLGNTTGLDRVGLYVNYDRPLEVHELARFKEFIQRRIKREPLQYIHGYKEFYSANLKVSRDVLIPRNETELLVDEVLKELINFNGDPRILEIGVGSGAVSIAIGKEIKNGKIFASDVMASAMHVAQENVILHGVSDIISLFVADLFSSIKMQNLFDMIVSNPPYVEKSAYTSLQPEIFYEPEIALVGGTDGLEFIKKIIEYAPTYLKACGYLFLEIGHGQIKDVLEMIKKTEQYSNIDVIKDYSGIDRVVKIKKRQL